MAENSSKPPKVFISYAWEEDVKLWARDLAKRLRQDGVETILDQWEINYGDQLPEFMEKAVRECDFVIFICTPKYKNKSDGRQGGVGYEGHIITAEIFEKSNHRKFIPVLRKGKWSSASPSWAAGKLYIDLSDDPYNEDNYLDLLRTFHGKKITSPPLGVPPSFDDIVRSPKSKSLLGEIKNSPTNRMEVSGNAPRNNAVRAGARTKGFLIPNNKDGEKAKPHVSEERVLEAAIEKPVYVGKSASLFVWIKRHGSKNILFAVSAIDENVILDENNVKAKSLEIEFPVENGQTLSAGITLRLVAYEFEPSIQQKKIKVPPQGDSEVCTFIVTPKQTGDLRLNLEVLKDEVSLGNRTLITTAIEAEKKVSASLVLVTIPIVVFVHAGLLTPEKSELSEAGQRDYEEAAREAVEREYSKKASREDIAKSEVERLYREEAESKMNQEMERSYRERAKLEAADKASYGRTKNSPKKVASSTHNNKPSYELDPKPNPKPNTNLASVFMYILSIVLCIGLYNLLLYVYHWLQNILR